MGLIRERGIDAVIFDMDGTLLDSTASVERCWDHLAEAMGIDRATAPFKHGVPSMATIRLCFPDAPDEEIQEWNRIHLRLEVEDAGGCTPIPGVFELLSALDAAQIPWGIATSCQRDLGIARHAAAGLPMPGVFVVAEDYAKGKPSPDPFLLAAQRLGVDPTRAVVVEDAPAGVAAGLAAGSYVVAMTSTHAADEVAHAHVVLDALSELQTLLLG